MKIHFVKNDWGRLMPIHFDECCKAMTLQFSPEDKSVYRLSRGEPSLFKLDPSGRNVVEHNVTNCPFCGAKIEFIKRELKEIEYS